MEKRFEEFGFSIDGIVLLRDNETKSLKALSVSLVCDLLNKQDEKIEELEEWVQAKDILINSYISIVGTLDNAKQLQQSQNQKAIECLEKIKEKTILFCVNDEPKLTGHYVSIKEIDNQIAELRGKENE